MADRINATYHHDNVLILYQRANSSTGEVSPIWYYDINFPRQKRIRHISTKHKDYTDALLYAESQYRSLSARVATGVKLHAWSFERIARQSKEYYHEQYRAGYLEELRYERLVRSIDKVFNPYFKDLGKDFISINTIDIEDWVVWRTNKGKMRTYTSNHEKSGEWIEGSKPATGTINYELQMLRMIYEFAKKRELILPAQVPEIKSIKEDKRATKKPHITPGDWSRIQTYVRHHYVDDIPDNLINLQTQLKYYRQLSRHLWTILWETGARVGEIRTLKWGDIDEREIKIGEGDPVKRLILKLDGKIGIRHTVAQPWTKIVFDRWKDMCAEYGMTTHKGDFVFRHPHFTNISNKNGTSKAGEPIGTTNQSFQLILRKLDMLPPKGTKDFTHYRKGLSVYSLRHGYITRQLISGINIHALSKNAGVSLDTLIKFYDHAISTDFIEEITKFDVYGSDMVIAQKEKLKQEHDLG